MKNCWDLGQLCRKGVQVILSLSKRTRAVKTWWEDGPHSLPQKNYTTRPREFQNLKPSAARLYFIFLSHFIMPLFQKKIWCDAGRVYGSTVFHATRRIPESERIWKDHFSSNRQPRCEQIYINCGLLSKDISRTLRSRRCSTSQTNTVDCHAVGRSPHWVVRVVAGIENKKMTHQRLRITCEQG